MIISSRLRLNLIVHVLKISLSSFHILVLLSPFHQTIFVCFQTETSSDEKRLEAPVGTTTTDDGPTENVRPDEGEPVADDGGKA